MLILSLCDTITALSYRLVLFQWFPNPTIYCLPIFIMMLMCYIIIMKVNELLVNFTGPCRHLDHLHSIFALCFTVSFFALSFWQMCLLSYQRSFCKHSFSFAILLITIRFCVQDIIARMSLHSYLWTDSINFDARMRDGLTVFFRKIISLL